MDEMLILAYYHLRRKYPWMTAQQAVAGLKSWSKKYGKVEIIHMDKIVFGTTPVNYWKLWWSPAIED